MCPPPYPACGPLSLSPEGVSNLGGILHFTLQLVNLLVVVLQRLADGLLEGIYLDKVWEQWQHILYLDDTSRLP